MKTEKSIFILGLTVGILMLVSQVRSHPQCLDFRPPFRPARGLAFCAQYSQYSCCTSERDLEIYSEFVRTLFSHRNRTSAIRCQGLLYHIMCTPCSPYAVHIYDAETDGVASLFPGLCNFSCLYFFDRCREFVPVLTTDANLRALSADPNNGPAFCDASKVTDNIYCYPSILYNDRFQTELQQTFSSSEGCICLEEFASNLRNPLIFKHVPDGSGRIVVGEQIGVMHIFYKDGRQLSDAFLDLSDVVLVSSFRGDERGLLGLAFHPNFTQNGKFYCYFYAQSNRRAVTQLREFTVSATNPNKADAASSKVLLELEQPYGNHNGGETTFGTDGYLYLFTGDGGAGGDPGNRAQDKSNLLGKALRIDVNGPDGNYTIPPDNPFVDGSGRPEVFAYGLRNPWRCDVDEGDQVTGQGRGRIFCGDVGQGAFEEIDIIEKGKDYGWRRREGFQCYRPQNCGNPLADEVLPIFAYNRSVGRSVIGGHVYRGCANPALNGAYILGDYDTGVLFKLEQTTPQGSWRETQLRACGPSVCRNGLVSRYEPNILSFGEDDDGEVYILTTRGAVSNRFNGKIYKIIDPRRRGDPAQCRSRRNRGRGRG